MSQSDETNELLREIRDILGKREQQYKDHLASVERAYEKQLRESQQAETRKAVRYWTFLFFVVLAATIAHSNWELLWK